MTEDNTKRRNYHIKSGDTRNASINVTKEEVMEGTDVDNITPDTFLRTKEGKPMWLITHKNYFKNVEGRLSRDFVGGAENYDVKSVSQFTLLCNHGLREHHTICDIGCGDLALGRLLIPYLLPKKYCGIEPQQWLLEEGCKTNTGFDIHDIKQTAFVLSEEFEFNLFDRMFDYIIAGSVFSHAHPEQIKLCMRNARDVMTEDSIFLASYVEGDVNRYLPGWIYPSVNVYTEEFMKEMAEESGLVGERLYVPSFHQIFMRLTKCN